MAEAARRFRASEDDEEWRRLRDEGSPSLAEREGGYAISTEEGWARVPEGAVIERNGVELRLIPGGLSEINEAGPGRSWVRDPESGALRGVELLKESASNVVSAKGGEAESEPEGEGEEVGSLLGIEPAGPEGLSESEEMSLELRAALARVDADTPEEVLPEASATSSAAAWRPAAADVGGAGARKENLDRPQWAKGVGEAAEREAASPKEGNGIAARRLGDGIATPGLPRLTEEPKAPPTWSNPLGKLRNWVNEADESYSFHRTRRFLSALVGGQWEDRVAPDGDAIRVKVWRCHGIVHRGSGPAESGPGWRVYRKWGSLHRDGDKPAALVMGSRAYARGGVIDRADGTGRPAITTTADERVFFEGGGVGRKDGPAVVGPQGTRVWMRNGVEVASPDGSPSVQVEADGVRFSRGSSFIGAAADRFEAASGQVLEKWLYQGKETRLEGPALIETRPGLPGAGASRREAWMIEGNEFDRSTPEGVAEWEKARSDFLKKLPRVDADRFRAVEIFGRAADARGRDFEIGGGSEDRRWAAEVRRAGRDGRVAKIESEGWLAADRTVAGMTFRAAKATLRGVQNAGLGFGSEQAEPNGIGAFVTRGGIGREEFAAALNLSDEPERLLRAAEGLARASGVGDVEQQREDPGVAVAELFEAHGAKGRAGKEDVLRLAIDPETARRIVGDPDRVDLTRRASASAPAGGIEGLVAGNGAIYRANASLLRMGARQSGGFVSIEVPRAAAIAEARASFDPSRVVKALKNGVEKSEATREEENAKRSEIFFGRALVRQSSVRGIGD